MVDKQAGDEIWTRGPQLGKLMLYHWATPAWLRQLYLSIYKDVKKICRLTYCQFLGRNYEYWVSTTKQKCDLLAKTKIFLYGVLDRPPNNSTPIQIKPCCDRLAKFKRRSPTGRSVIYDWALRNSGLRLLATPPAKGMSTRDEPVLARGLNVNVHAVRRILRKVRTQPMATRLMISSVPIKTSPARPLRHRGTIIYDPIPVNLTYAALLFSNFISCKVACRHSYSSIFLVF